MKRILSLVILTIITVNSFGQTLYQNDLYGFNCKVPADWTVYAEMKHDKINQNSIIDWGLPKVYSLLEKTKIENAVSITAYKRKEINSIENLINFEFNRMKNNLIEKIKLEGTKNTTYNVLTKIDGFTYKTQLIFLFENNIGYILNFTATQGTFDININKFIEFEKGITFFRPTNEEVMTTAKFPFQTKGLYVARTKQIKTENLQMEIYTYLRFYEDGKIITQSVNTLNPTSVSKWLLKENKRYERIGVVNCNDNNCVFEVTNKDLDDSKIEGVKTDKYTCKITDNNKILIAVSIDNGETENFWFDFYKIEN